MKRVLCLRLNNWPVQRQQNLLPAEQRTRVAIYTPAPGGEPKKKRKHALKQHADVRFARQLLPSARGGAATLCVSDEAWAAGVRAGMPLAEARSMAAPLRSASEQKTNSNSASETQFIEWDADADRKALLDLAELTRPFAPIVGLDESPMPDCLLMDVSGCGQLFGGESVLAESLVQLFARQGIRCRALISDTVATAWAFAHIRGHQLHEQINPGDSHRIDQSWLAPTIIIPPNQALSYLELFPLAAGRIPPADIAILLQLGILSLKQLFGLPAEDLPSRLSDEAIQRLRQITSVEEEMITSIPEANPVAATWTSEFAATNRGELQQVFQHLIEQISAQLKRRTLGAIRLISTLTYEDGSRENVEAEMVKPVQEAGDLYDVLNLRLESIRLSQSVFSVRMQAKVAPLPAARQKDLFSSTEHLEPAEELTTVVNRLNSRLGNSAVLTASPSQDPTPERSVKLTPVVSSEFDSARQTPEIQMQELVHPESLPTTDKLPTNRPLFLLPMPVQISRTPSQDLLTDFLWDGQRQVVGHSAGPERIQTQWWQEHPLHRDYFHVQTNQGSEFWIYQDLNSLDWFVHGIFE